MIIPFRYKETAVQRGQVTCSTSLSEKGSSSQVEPGFEPSWCGSTFYTLTVNSWKAGATSEESLSLAPSKGLGTQ